MKRRKAHLWPYDPQMAELLGLPERSRPSTVKRYLKERVFRARCKPCWELKYCPYGPLVEQFPLPRIIRAEAIEHDDFLKKQLAAKAYDRVHTKIFTAQVKEFDPLKYPVGIPEEEEFMRCRIFGHYCPAFFSSEPFTETSDYRNATTSVSFQAKLRVARRDNYTCQECGDPLRENEMEFDPPYPARSRWYVGRA